MDNAEKKDTASQEQDSSSPKTRNLADGSPYAEHMKEGMQAYSQQQYQAALREFEAAAVLEPEDVAAQLMRGAILQETEQNDDAEKILRPLVDDKELGSRAHTNLGILAKRRGDFASAVQHFRSSVSNDFQFAPAHYQLAMALLAQGELAEGWREYEWRWYTPRFTKLPCTQPRWDGKPLDGTLLVHTEQATEDTLHFCRYLPMIRPRCRRLIFVCAERMRDMFATPDWADEIRFPGEIPVDAFEAYLPLLSAPGILKTDLDSVPQEIPYLKPPASAHSLADPKPATAKLKVGLAWKMGTADVSDRFRYCLLSDSAAVLAVPQIAFYALQADSSDTGTIQEFSGVQGPPKPLNDLVELATALRQLDLLISVDSTTAHLAGALGVPTWTLLSQRSHWRWLLDRDDSPWYPTMRLFRQPTTDDWEELWTRVATELAGVVEGRVMLPPSRVELHS